eukprot:Rhum_TRINITY_DN7294_c0_g1::Rhum_TRINITY_DN7294_c0_g1_i1::g.22198::m.22198
MRREVIGTALRRGARARSAVTQGRATAELLYAADAECGSLDAQWAQQLGRATVDDMTKRREQLLADLEEGSVDECYMAQANQWDRLFARKASLASASMIPHFRHEHRDFRHAVSEWILQGADAVEAHAEAERAMQSYIMLGGDRQHAALRWASFDVLERITVKHDPVIRMLNVQVAPKDPATQLTGSELEELTGQYSRSFADEARRIRAVKAAMMRNLEDCVGYLLSAVEGDVGPDSKAIHALLQEWVKMSPAERDTEVRKFKGSAVSLARSHVESLLRDLSNPESLERDIIGLDSVESLTTVTPKVLFRDTGLKRLSLRLFAKEVLFLGLYLDKVSAPTHSLFYSVFPEDAVLPTRQPSMLDHPIGRAGFSKREVADTNKYLTVERKYRHARGLDCGDNAVIAFQENADVRRSMKIDVIAFLLCQADIDSNLFDRPKARTEDESGSGVSREDPAVPMYDCVDVSMSHYYSTVLEDGRVIQCLQGNEVFLRTRVAVEHGYSSCFATMTTAELNELLRNRGSGTSMDGIVDFFPYEAFKRTIGAAPEVVAQDLWRKMSAEEQTKYGAAFARDPEYADDGDHNPTVDTLLPEYAQAGVVPSSLAIFQSFGLLHPYWDCPHGFEAYCSALLRERREGPDADTPEDAEQEVEEAIRSAIPKWLRLDVKERLAFISAADAPASDEVLLIRSKVYDVAREEDQRWFFTTRDRFGAPGRQFFKGAEEEWAVLTDGEKFRYHMIAPFAHFDALMTKLSEALNLRYFSTRYLDAQARLTPGMISPFTLRQAYKAWALPNGGSSHARCPSANPLHVTPVVPLSPFSEECPSWRGVNLSTQPAAARALHLLWESDASLRNADSRATHRPFPDQKVSPLFLRSLLAILRVRDPTGSTTVANCFAEAKVRAGLGHLPPGFYNTPEDVTNNAELLSLLKQHCSSAAAVSDAYVAALYPTYEPFELYAVTENSGFVREHLQKNKTLPTKRILYEQFTGAEVEDQERIAAFCKKQHGSTSDNANVGAFLDFGTGSQMSNPIAFETRVNSLVPAAQRTDPLHHRCAWILKNNSDVLADRTQPIGFAVDVLRIVNANWDDQAVRTLFRSYMLAEKSQWLTNMATNSILGVDDKRMGGFSHFSGRVLEGFASSKAIEHIVFQLWASLPVNARRLYCRQESLVETVDLNTDDEEVQHWYSVSTHGTAGLAALNASLAELPLRKTTPFMLLLRRQLATLLEVPPSSVQHTDPTLVISEVMQQYQCLTADEHAKLAKEAAADNVSRKAEVWDLVSVSQGAVDPETGKLSLSLRAHAALKPLLNLPVAGGSHFSCLPIAHFASCLLESEADPCSAASTRGGPRLSDGTMDKETLLRHYLSLPLNQRLPYVLQARKYALALDLTNTPLSGKMKLAALIFASETMCDHSAYKALPDHRRAFYERMELAVLSKFFDASLLQGPCTALGVIAASAENCWMSYSEIEHRFHDLVLQGVPLGDVEQVSLKNRAWGTKYLGCRMHTNVPVAAVLCREASNVLRSLGAKAVLCADLYLPEAEAEDAWICAQLDERATAYSKLQELIVDTSACITQGDMPPDVPHTHLLPEFPSASDADKMVTLKDMSQGLVEQVLSNDAALNQFPYFSTVPDVVESVFHVAGDQVSLVLSESTSESFWRYLAHYRATHNELHHRVRGLETRGTTESFQGGSSCDEFMKNIDQLVQNSFADGVKLTCFMDYIMDAVRGNSERCYNYAVAEATVVLQRLKLANFGHTYDPATDSLFAKKVHDTVSSILLTDGMSEIDGKLLDVSNEKDAESTAIETMVMARLHDGELKGHRAFEYWKPLTSRLSFPLFCHAKLTRNIRVEDVFTSAQGHMGLEGEQAEAAAAQVSNAAWTQLTIEEKLPYYAFAGQLRDDFRAEVSRLSGMPGHQQHGGDATEDDATAVLLVSQVIENIKEMLHYKERHLRSYENQFEKLMPKVSQKSSAKTRHTAGQLLKDRLRGLQGEKLRKALLDVNFEEILREAGTMVQSDSSSDMLFSNL